MRDDPKHAFAMRNAVRARTSALSTERGTYILMVELSSTVEIEVGSLGRLSFEPGVWAYVGSAFGRGGLAARLGRHLVNSRSRHWHVDHLLDEGEVIGALVGTHDSRRECGWARWTAARAVRPVSGFGSSDCRCASHLFLLGGEDELEEMVREAARDLQARLVTKPRE